VFQKRRKMRKKWKKLRKILRTYFSLNLKMLNLLTQLIIKTKNRMKIMTVVGLNSKKERMLSLLILKTDLN
jgi:uncharacterized membrane protein